MSEPDSPCNTFFPLLLRFSGCFPPIKNTAQKRYWYTYSSFSFVVSLTSRRFFRPPLIFFSSSVREFELLWYSSFSLVNSTSTTRRVYFVWKGVLTSSHLSTAPVLGKVRINGMSTCLPCICFNCPSSSTPSFFFLQAAFDFALAMGSFLSLLNSVSCLRPHTELKFRGHSFRASNSILQLSEVDPYPLFPLP